MNLLLLQIAFALLLLLCFLVLGKYISRFNCWKRLGIPYLEPCYVCGHRVFRRFLFKSYAECLDLLYLKARAQNLRYCGFFQFGSPMLMILDPELIERILVKDFNHFSNHNHFRYDPNHLFAQQLYSVNDVKWKTLRRRMTSMFSATSMRLITNRMGGCSEQMERHFNKMYNSTWVNAHELAISFTSDLISRTLGTDLRSFSDEKTPLLLALEKAFAPSVLSMLASFCFIFYPDLGFKFGVMSKSEYAVFKSFLEDNIQRRLDEKSLGKKSDLFQFLLDLAENETAVDSDDELEESAEENVAFKVEETSGGDQVTMSKSKEMMLVSQLMWTLTDAIETNSGPLSFCFHQLSLHHKHQQKIKEEIDAAFEKHATKIITDDVLKDLKHTEKVVKETLRLHPGFVPLVRICTKEYRIPDSTKTIPKGTVIVVPNYSLQLDPEYHSDPLEFRPDRFNEENSNKTRPFTYLPFGNGPRGCFGARYAMTVMKFSVASVVSKYEIKPVNTKTDVVPFHPLSPILLRSRKPIFVRFTRRGENQ